MRAARRYSAATAVHGAQFMTKSELIEILARKRSDIPYKDVEQAVKTLLEQMSDSLAHGERIEIRGFGSFSVRNRKPRATKNPKTGKMMHIPERKTLHFTMSKSLKDVLIEDKEE